jgi:polyisoprenoid-binding protein YceI
MPNPTTAAAAGPAQPGEWIADLATSTVSFTVRNFGLRSVTGQVPLVSARVTVGPSGQPVSVRAELDARGIDTGHPRRDRDLRGARFLATDRWPVISFQASSVQASGAGWTIAGTLTVKDPDCPVRLDVTGANIRPNDPAASVNLCASARLDRRSAGVNAAPAFLIGHTISLSLAIRLRPPATVPVAQTPAKQGHRCSHGEIESQPGRGEIGTSAAAG